MYHLIIKPYGTNTWITADLGTDQPAFTFEANAVAELNSRSANYSQRLSLPQSSNNCHIFDNMQTQQINSNFPEKLHSCRLFSNGIPIAGYGSVIKLLNIKNNKFEVCILSGLANLFETLKAIDLDTWNGLDTCRLPIQSKAIQTPAKDYVNAVYNTGCSRYTNNLIQGALVYNMPIIRMLYGNAGIIPKLLAAAGNYTLVSNCTTEMNKMALSLANNTANSDGEQIYSYPNTYKMMAFNLYEQVKPSYTTQFKITGTTLGVRVVINNMSPSDVNQIYFDPYNHNPTMTLQAMNQNQENIPLSAWNFNEDTCSLDYTYDTGELPNTGITIDNDVYYSNQAGEFYKSDYSGAGNHLYQNTAIYLVYITHNITTATPGITFPLASNIGMSNGLDVFKILVQTLGLIVEVDEKTKTVYAYSFAKIYENKAYAIDWSDKLDNGSEDRSFLIDGYAQKNEITFAENSKTKFTDNAYIPYNNETTDSEAQLAKINTESGQDDVVEFYTLNDDGEAEYKKLSKPHLLTFKTSIAEINLKYKVTGHVAAATIADTYYAALAELLNKSRCITADFLLTDEDIRTFSNLIPVYLQQYGAFFYVNKIKNYIAGQLTEVELVQL